MWVSRDQGAGWPISLRSARPIDLLRVPQASAAGPGGLQPERGAERRSWWVMASMVGGSRGVVQGAGPVVVVAATAVILAGCGSAAGRQSPPGGVGGTAAAVPRVTVAPSRWLSQGQRVRVIVTGFPTETRVFLSECAPVRGSVTRISRRGCGMGHASQRFLVTGRRGTAEGRFAVQVVAATGPPGSRVAKCWPSCKLVATTGRMGGAGAVVAYAVIRFGQRRRPPLPAARAPASAPFTVLSRVRVPGRAWLVLAAGRMLYALSVAGRGFVITRVDPAAGRAGPARPMTQVAGMGLGGGLLWVARRAPSPRGGTPSVVALNPATLAVVHTVALPQQPGWGPSPIAYAGGLIWVAGTRSLIAINPATAALAATVPLARAARTGGFTSVAASPDGVALWTTEGSPGGGPLSVQLRDARTGEVLAASKGPAASLGAAQIAAANNHAWLAVATGLLGRYLRISRRAGPLAQTRPKERHVFANGIAVYLAGRQLWILDAMTGSIACAADSTGRILAAAYDTGMDISDLAPLAPGRLALPINGKILIVRPKPACRP
jgi:hypothetical protein